MAILHGSISRDHAVISLEEEGGWRLRDVGSQNGSSVNEQPVTDVVMLTDRARVRFARVGFFFLEDATSLPFEQRRKPVKTIDFFTRAHTLVPDGDTDEFPTVSLAFQQPTGGGVGLIEIDGTSIQLTLAQFELLSILAKRMVADAAAPRETRGFVNAGALLQRLSLDSSGPGEDSVRQLVRRVRRLLANVNLGGLIESRQRLGYRLAAMPLIKRQR